MESKAQKAALARIKELVEYIKTTHWADIKDAVNEVEELIKNYDLMDRRDLIEKV